MRTLLTILCLWSVTASGQFIINPYRFAAATNSLGDVTAYWKLDESTGIGDRVDSGPNGQDLTVAGTQSATNAIINLGNNYPTGTSGDYCARADSATLSCGDIDFTVCAWMQRYDATPRGAVNKGGLGSAAVIEYGLYSDGSSWKFAVSNGSTVTTVVSAAVSSLTWYFVVAWHDATADTINIQVNDGTPVSAAHSVGCQDSTGSFNIGRAQDGFQFIGAIDEVGFWKRKLTDAERTYLYNSGAGRTCCPFP